MAPDSPDTHRGSPPPLRGFSLPAFRSLLRPQRTRPAAVKASPSFALDPSPPGFRLAPPNSATPPTPATLPAQISRSIAPGTNPAGTVPLPATKSPGSSSLSPAEPAILPVKSAPSIILRHRRHQPRRKILRQPLQRRILLLKKALHVRRNLILVAKQEIIRAVENFPRLALFKSNLALHGHKHRRRPPRRGIKQQRHGFHTQHLPAQHRVSVRRIGYHAIRSLRQKFMYGCSGQPLLDPVARRLILQRRHRNHANALRQRIAPPRDVVAAAARDCAHQEQRARNSPRPHASISANFTAFAAGNRILSAAPQNHQLPGCEGSASGFANWMAFSPVAPTLLGPPSLSAGIAKPASPHTFAIFPASAPGSSSAHAANAVP